MGEAIDRQFSKAEKEAIALNVNPGFFSSWLNQTESVESAESDGFFSSLAKAFGEGLKGYLEFEGLGLTRKPEINPVDQQNIRRTSLPKNAG